MRVNGRRTCAFCTVPIRPADSAEDSLIESTWMAEPSVSTKDYRDIVVRYALAVLAPLLAIYLRSLLNPLMGTANLYHTVWAAIVFSAWYCGFAPSILSTIVAAVGIWLWLLPRQGPFGVSSADFYGMIGFILFAGLIVAVGESNRRSRSRLTAAEREAQRANRGDRARAPHATAFRRRRCSKRSRSTGSMPRSAAPAGTRSGPAPRSGSSPSATTSVSGTPSISGPSCGRCSTAASQGRTPPRVPAVELDRARRLAVHRRGEARGPLDLLRPRLARCSSATACCTRSTRISS